MMTDYLEALLTMPHVAAPEVSRNGEWIAWTWFRLGPGGDVFMAPTDGSQPPQRLTQTDDDTIVLGWTPDDRSVLVIQDKDGNERYQLFRVDVDKPLEMVPLTEADPNYFLRGGDLHPNGRWLVYGANVDVTTGHEIEPTWIYRHDLESGERVPLACPKRPAYTWPRLNDAGTHILYGRQDRHPSGYQIWLVDIEGHEDRELFNFGDEVKVHARWFPDSRRVVVLAETPTHRRVGVWDMATGGDVNWLLDDPERNIESAYVPHRSDKIVLVDIRDARSYLSLLDPITGEETLLPPVNGNVRAIEPVGDETWIGVYESSQQPTDIVCFPFNDPANQTSISRVWERTDLTADDFAPAQDFRWQSVDGRTIQGWLYRPQGEANGTVVYVHGGPTSHSKDAINVEIQYLVRMGFNVLDPNYRGSTGFGISFRELIKADGWGGLEQEDIRTGVEALIQQGIAQPGKVGITGTSYGGYSSWCAITRYPTDIIAASAPICGMTDLVVDYQTTRPDLRPYSEEMLGGSPDEVPERYHERSPINFVDNIKGRLLIVQGMQDPNVTPENVRAVTKALQDASIEYELLAFEDEGHGIGKPRNRKRLYQHLAAFFTSSFVEGKT